jgi:hypothetical protein
MSMRLYVSCIVPAVRFCLCASHGDILFGEFGVNERVLRWQMDMLFPAVFTVRYQ